VACLNERLGRWGELKRRQQLSGREHERNADKQVERGPRLSFRRASPRVEMSRTDRAASTGSLESAEVGGQRPTTVNTIHDGLGYRLTVRAPRDAAAELEALMASLLAGFTFSD
jgi:hypothetical protein